MMAGDTILTLAEFQFGRLEVPAEIRFGGSQRLSVHELVGGARVIDAMGRSDRAIEWSGLLFGAEATQRARFLDGLRIAGLPMTLAWGEFRYSVIVRDFEATYQNFHQIPYRISCEVVADKTTPVATAGATPLDDQVTADMTAATATASLIGNATLTSSVATLSIAVGGVSTFNNAPQSTIAAVLQPIAAARAQVTTLQAAMSSALTSYTSAFGGVLPGDLPTAVAGELQAQLLAAQQSALLYGLGALLGRMAANLNSANNSPRTVAIAGGNLFTLAEQQYADATAWTGIARANGLVDPFITGAQTLKVPASADTAGGVLSA